MGGEVRSPDPHIEDSFTVGDPFAGAHDGHVTLRRSALGKAFMLLPSVVPGTHTPMPHLMMPKVVAFELQGRKLAMLEPNLDAAYKELPSIKLLQTFEVIDEDAASVTFNWHMGLESLPQDFGWEGVDSSDEQARLRGPKRSPPAVRVRSSFLRSAKIVDNGLELEQLSRLEPFEAASNGASELAKVDTVVVRARIVPYLPSESFQPRVSAMQEGIGYFEVAPNAPGKARPETLAMRWDVSPARGPITYSVSRNTPPQFVEAVADGVRYWNRVAGRDLVRVELDADPEAPIGNHRVMIHWVNWMAAGGAYGEFQGDPATGELLHGAIFLPSMFTRMGTDAMATVEGADATPAALANLVPRGFAPGKICDHPRHDLSSVLDGPLAGQVGLNERAVSDALRAVVAHEVGHTLGLRHNFAASGQTDLPDAASLHAALAAYAAESQHPGNASVSSVMDYLNNEEMVLQGAAIRHRALAYDVAAVQWGYGGVPVAVRDLGAPLFCTDVEAMQRVLGCDRFDSGPRPIANHVGVLRLARERLGGRLARALLRNPDAADAASPKAGAVDDTWMRAASKVFANLAQGASVLEVKRAMGPQRMLNPQAYAEAMQAALASAAQEVGGLPGMLAAAYPMDEAHAPVTGWLLEDFKRALEQAGVPCASAQALQSSFAPQAPMLEQMLLMASLSSLTGAYHVTTTEETVALLSGQAPMTPFAEGVVQPGWEPVLAEMGRHILLDSDGSGDLPRPRFCSSVRLAAVRLFSGQLFGAPDWAQAQRTQIIAELTQRREAEALRPVLGTASKSAAERTRWLRDELEIIGKLSDLNQ